MPNKVQMRRAVRAAVALAALSGAALIVPPLVLGDRKNTTATTSVQAASRDSFTLSEPMVVSSEPRVVVTKGTLSVLRDAAPKGIGDTLLQYITGRRAALALDNGEIDIDLEQAASGGASASSANDFTSSEVLAALSKALSSFEFRSLSLKDVAVNVSLEIGRVEQVMLKSAELEMPKSGERIVSGSLIFRGEPVSFDLAVGAPNPGEKTTSPEEPVPVRATVKCLHLEGHFDGRLATSDRTYIAANSATLSIPNIRKAARWLGESWPDGQGLSAFTARGSLLLGTRSMEFQNARFSLDGNSASGTLAVRLSGERPSIEGTLAFDAFNIGPYTAAKKQTPLAVAADWLSDLRLPGTPKPSLITEVDADLRLSAKSIVSNAQILGRTAASLSIKDGLLSAELAELELEQGGTGAGELSLDMRAIEPRFTLRGELRNLDFERALDYRGLASPLSGQGSVLVDLTGAGAREDALLSSLAGTVTLDMQDGGTLGLDVAALPAVAAPQASTTSPETPWARLGQGSTKLDRLVAKFSGTNGVFTADSVEASAGDVVMVALGSIAVASRTIDVTLKMAPKDAVDGTLTTGSITSPARTTAEPAPAAPASTAYRVRGPWASPAVNAVTTPGKSAKPGLPLPYPAPSKSRG